MSGTAKQQVFHSNSGTQPSLKCKIPLQHQTWVCLGQTQRHSDEDSAGFKG